jgi:hypothetical protein
MAACVRFKQRLAKYAKIRHDFVCVELNHPVGAIGCLPQRLLTLMGVVLHGMVAGACIVARPEVQFSLRVEGLQPRQAIING